MRQWRAQAAAMTLGLALAMPAAAVTVGDMRALSAVGEPLRLDIGLVDAFDIQEADITVGVASAADHGRFGITRPAWADQLVFVLGHDAQGQLLVHVSGPALMQAAPVSFLIQVGWPGHIRMQQVTTTLRDPAESLAADQANAPELPAAVSAEADSVVVAVSPAAAPMSAAPSAAAGPNDSVIIPVVSAVKPPVAGSARAVGQGGQRIRVQRGDTLSSLASQWDRDLSLAQRQQLIGEANPGAFVGGDINRLRAGARIVLPDTDARALPSRREASAWLTRALQPGEGKALVRPVEVADDGQSAPVTAKSDVTLTLVAPGKGTDTAAGKAAGDAAADADGKNAASAAAALSDAEQTRAGLLNERRTLQARLNELNRKTTEEDARLTLLDDRLAAFERGERPAPLDAASAQGQSASDRVMVWGIAAGLFMLLLFVLWLRQRSADAEAAAQEAARRQPVYEEFEALPEVAESAYLGDDDEPQVTDEYDFLTDSEAEAFQTRLDLAQAYMDMNETQAASDLLQLVQQGGTPEQRRRAADLLQSLGGVA